MKFVVSLNKETKSWYISLMILPHRVVHIPFGRMIKFKSFALFSVDHLPHPIVSNLKPVFVFAKLQHSLNI